LHSQTAKQNRNFKQNIEVIHNDINTKIKELVNRSGASRAATYAVAAASGCSTSIGSAPAAPAAVVSAEVRDDEGNHIAASLTHVATATVATTTVVANTVLLEGAFDELEDWFLQHADSGYDDFADRVVEKTAPFFRVASLHRSEALSWDAYNAEYRGVRGCILWDRICALFRHGARDPRDCPDDVLRIVARLLALWKARPPRRDAAAIASCAGAVQIVTSQVKDPRRRMLIEDVPIWGKALL
jgi:hypothetical protein